MVDELTPRAARPWFSRTALTVGLAMASLTVAGGILRLISPPTPGPADLALFAREIMVISPYELHPEPAEAFTYASLILLSPVLLTAAALGARRLAPAGPGRADGLAAAAAVAVAAVVVGLDPASTNFRMVLPAFLSVSALAAAGAWGDLRLQRSRIAAPAAAAIAFIGGAALLIAASWRDARSIAEPSLNYEAFAYSVVAAARGRICLVNLPTQYGCYGAVIGPVLRGMGATVSHVTLLCAALATTSLAAVAGFAARTLRSPILALGAVLGLAVTTLAATQASFFQYMPLRVLFPALSLPAILWWDVRPGALKAAALGAGAGLALFWNVDAGVPVLGALGLYILLAQASGAGDLRRRCGLAAAYGSAALIAGLALLAALAARRHGWPDLGSALEYHRLFVVSGLAMLPMPAPPAAWTVCAALAAGALAGFAAAWRNGAASRGADHAAFLAVLATGLFSYYVGRSHPEVLVCASWPFLVLAFKLLDSAPLGRGKLAFAARALGALLVVLLAATGLRMAPSLHARPPPGPDPTAEEIAYIRDHTAPGAPVALLASKQAVILGELGRAAVLPGPGFSELLTYRDSDALFAWLVRTGPHDLFVSRDVVYQRDLTGLSYWVAAGLPRLNAVYDIADFGPGGRMLHFVRKASAPPAP